VVTPPAGVLTNHTRTGVPVAGTDGSVGLVSRSIALCALLAFGCGTASVTEIVVVADTDLTVPDGIDAIRISVTDEAGALQEGLADLRAGAPRPVTLGLVSQSGEGTLEVVVIGERDGIEILRRTGRVTFERGRMLALRMDLWERCVAQLCGAERACGDAGCRPIVIDPAELTEWSGAPPPSPDAAIVPDTGVPTRDAGPRDAGHLFDTSVPSDGHVSNGDAGHDAAVTFDAAFDAGTETDASEAPDAVVEVDAAFADDVVYPDAWVAECGSDLECDDGWSCTADTCDLGRCVHAPRDSACDDGISCTSERCDAFLGCVYDTSDAACEDGLTCTTNTCDRLLGCVSTPLHAMCGGGSYCDTTAGCTVAPTFTDIYSTIISVRCTPCHVTSVPRSGTLDMGSQSVAHASLVGVTARCGAGANTRVVAGDSSHSLLWRKVAGVDLCGVRMPRMLTPLDDTQIAQIAHWIEAGALE
jgi:hypothetical protein